MNNKVDLALDINIDDNNGVSMNKSYIKDENPVTKKDIEWQDLNKNGKPRPTDANLKALIYAYGNINVYYNEMSNNIEITGFNNCNNNIKKQKIVLKKYCTANNLEITQQEFDNMLYDIATDNSYHPFLDKLEEIYKNGFDYEKNYHIIDEVFNCLPVDTSFCELEFYEMLFVKWCINVVRQCENNYDKKIMPNGVLIIQGNQGCRKTTFCEKLMPSNEFVLTGSKLDPENKDSIQQNTNKVIVELGEMDSTFKAQQSALKAFFTRSTDVYRAAYDRNQSEIPRRTTFVGTVNKVDFLKDETGNRRYWIIPLKEGRNVDIEKMEKLNMWDFWSAIYYVYKNNMVKEYLEKDEMEKLNELNKRYNEENDCAIALNEKFDFDEKDIKKYTIMNLNEIREVIGSFNTKQIKQELEKKGYKYKKHTVTINGKREDKKGIKMPPQI